MQPRSPHFTYRDILLLLLSHLFCVYVEFGKSNCFTAKWCYNVAPFEPPWQSRTDSKSHPEHNCRREVPNSWPRWQFKDNWIHKGNYWSSLDFGFGVSKKFLLMIFEFQSIFYLFPQLIGKNGITSA